MRRIGMALAGLALLVPACGMVPDDAYAQAPPGQDCRAAEHHQFDFWIGVWDVTVVKEPGKPQAAGTNRIERVMGGCALEGGNALLLSGTY